MQSLPHIPVIRRGRVYESLDKIAIADHRNGGVLAHISQVNAGIIRKDLQRIGESRAALKKFTVEQLIGICAKAGELFQEGDLPLGDKGHRQTAKDYIKTLSLTSGLPHVMVRRNMAKIRQALANMRTILAGLTRGLDLKIIDDGYGTQSGSPCSFYPAAQALGLVMPSNSPAVNSLWLPAIPLKIPVIIKPGREEPWTPYRLIQAFIAAGCPAEAFGFYPTDHEGAGEILRTCGRALIFGDKSTTQQYANNPAIQIHGPGFSKILIGDDEIERWPEFIDVMVSAISDNGGRSCINASAIVVPKYAREIAGALAQKLGPVAPVSPTDENARLSGFANPKMAEYIDGAIEQDLKVPGAEEMTAKYRSGPRKTLFEGGTYMRPTIVLCDSFAHPLANREFLCPYASVVQVPQSEMLKQIGPSLAVAAITKDSAFIDQLLDCPLIERLNIGPISTMNVTWDQPHEGNLFEFLYKRRSIMHAEPVPPASRRPEPELKLAGGTPAVQNAIVEDFNFHSRTRLVYGPNALDSLGKFAKEYGAKSVLLVTDPGLAAAGHAARAEAVLKKEGLAVHTYDRSKVNPTTREVADCVQFAQDRRIDFIVGLGGGSSMDTAKGANFILTNGGKMSDYWGINKATKPMLPMIAIPTTAGTGSESQCYALVADETTHQKMACGDDKAYPVVALLDPALNATCPRRVTADSGIDAISHAIESFVCTARTPVSQLFSREAWKLANNAFETVLREPNNLDARGQMLLASAYAGMAISQSMLGAAHSAANPLTAHFDFAHGRAVGMMLPHVVAFNAQQPDAAALYAELAHVKHIPKAATPVQALIARLNALLNAAEMPATLEACGVKRDAIAKMSEEAAHQWTAKFNPRPIIAADFSGLYEAAFKPRDAALSGG